MICSAVTRFASPSSEQLFPWVKLRGRSVLAGLWFVSLLKCILSWQITAVHKRKWDSFFSLGSCWGFCQQHQAKALDVLKLSLMHRCFPKQTIYDHATEGKVEGPHGELFIILLMASLCFPSEHPFCRQKSGV